MDNEVVYKEFDTAAVLSVATGKMLAEMDKIYEVLTFLVGRDIFTHEFVYFQPQAQKFILSIYPEFSGVIVNGPFKTDEEFQEFIALKKSVYGNETVLRSMVPGVDFEYKSFEEVIAWIKKPCTVICVDDENDESLEDEIKPSDVRKISPKIKIRRSKKRK